MRGEKGEMQARVILTFYHLNPPEKGNFFLFYLLLYCEVTYKNNYPIYTISKTTILYTLIYSRKTILYTLIYFYM
jgi:hypothetical protein